MKEVSDNNFEQQVLQSSLPVLVDFSAQWCGPCKMLTPILEDLSAEYEGRYEIVKIDVDANPQTTQKYGIRAMPTLMVFRDGEVRGQKIGGGSKGQLKSFLDSHL